MLNKNSIKRLTEASIAIVLALVLAVHFGTTAIYLSPLSPIKIRLAPFIHSYMHPLFDQNWELFAPDPMVDTRLLLVACRVVDKNGSLSEHSWSNVSTPFMDLKYRYRLSPADRLARAQLASVSMIYEQENALILMLTERASDGSEQHQEIARAVEEYKTEKQKLGLRLLNRTASAECDRRYAHYGQIKEARVRMIVIKSPPFSQRELPLEAGKMMHVDFPWAPYERIAALH